MHFADYFFDDLFVDWAVQNQINRAANQVNKEYNAVDRLTESLERRVQSLEKEQGRVAIDKRQLIEKA